MISFCECFCSRRLYYLLSSVDRSRRSEPVDEDRSPAQHNPPQWRIRGARRSVRRYCGDGRNLHTRGEAASKATELAHVLFRVEAQIAVLPHLAGVALVHRHGSGGGFVNANKVRF